MNFPACLILVNLLWLMGKVTPAVIVEAPTTGDYCFTTDPIREQVRRFFSKTAYQFIRGHENIIPDNDCLPERFWLLSRHGTRLTPAKDTKILREKLPEIQKEILENYARDPKSSELCAEDLHLLETWKWDTNITEDQSEYLSQQGWEDLRGIAKYFQQQFPQRFPRKYSEEKFFFRHTNKQRTEASFQAFAEGLFGSYANVKAAPIPDKDTLLRPYDFSEDWQEQKKEIYQEGSEYMKFRKGPEFLNVLASVSKRGGYRDVQTAEKVELIFKACTYEQAWRIHEPSSWCSFFTPDDVKVLEYLHDLEEYYLSGSGSELNKLLPLELLDNFLNHFVNESEPRVVAFFAHSTIIELFLTTMGLAEDEMDLRADNYEEMENRKWRTSLLAPFAGNLAVVGFTCKPQSKNHLMFILNEKVLSVVN